MWKKLPPSFICKSLFFLSFHFFFTATASFAQTNLSGKVLSGDTALSGVSVIVKGTPAGTQTDSKGAFTINAPANGKLVFSYAGFATKEVEINGRTNFSIQLSYQPSAMDEIVVIGYGRQKKINLTGSVSTISGNELISRPAANVENLLQGRVSGLEVVQSTGEPGNDFASLRVRGLGTFSSAGSAPLVLINGVQGNLNGINPQDVESVSVLKDAASAAIYGARAANGVILITTKQGKAGVLNLEYSGNYQVQQPTKLPNLVTNSARFMEYWNQANDRSGEAPYFSNAEIDAFRNATDKVKYPNFDWIDAMLSNGNQQSHHLSMNGGNDKTIFNFSMGYLDQDGLNKVYNFKRYNMLLSMTSKLNKVVNFGVNISGNYKDKIGPVFSSEDFVLHTYTAGPNYMPYLNDGSGKWTWRYNSAAWHNRNPLQTLAYGNITDKVYSLQGQAYVDINIMKDLVMEIKGAVNYDDRFNKHQEHNVPSYFYADNTLAASGTSFNLGVTDYSVRNILTTFYSTLNYSKSIAVDHNFRILAGYSQESNNYNFLQGHKTLFPSDNLGELNAGSSNGQWLNGSSEDWAIQSLFGRLNYDFKGKYLIEANARYDGSSRIAKDQRWGLFPSLSVGWRISEEAFMDNVGWLDELKLRASQGNLGNQNIGVYPYQDILSLNAYAFSNSVSQGVAVNRLTDKNIKWETTSVTDFGVDFSIRKGLLSFTADWYNKVTDDILYAINIPASIGLSSPTINYAKMKNTGFEFELGHRNIIGEVQYAVSANFSTYKNEVLLVKAPSYGTVTIQEGLPWQSYYLTEWIGIFQSQDEIDKSPQHPYNPKPGDLKFKDQNGDNLIDSKDRIVVDGAFPKFYYGGSVNISWKNLDLSTFFQGVQGQKNYLTSWGAYEPFIQGMAPTEEFAQNAWTPENKSNTSPGMYKAGYGAISGTPSTYFLKNASYFRLKNLGIGYNFPKTIHQRIGMKGLRVFASADNLFTVTTLTNADPERIGNSVFQTYPQLKTFTAGVNVKF